MPIGNASAIINGDGLNVSAAIGFLVGDVGATGRVTASDISATNARFDLDRAGVIGNSAISVTKSQAGAMRP